MHDAIWMQEALKEAETALSEGEVPVGAVVVQNDTVIARAHNRCVQSNDPTCHAELLAMREAYAKLGSLAGCTLYVTLEPCAMCAGAVVQLQLPRLVYGAYNALTGCCGSKLDLTDHWLDWSVETIGGVLETPCEALMKRFFADLRA